MSVLKLKDDMFLVVQQTGEQSATGRQEHVTMGVTSNSRTVAIQPVILPWVKVVVNSYKFFTHPVPGSQDLNFLWMSLVENPKRPAVRWKWKRTENRDNHKGNLIMCFYEKK